MKKIENYVGNSAKTYVLSSNKLAHFVESYYSIFRAKTFDTFGIRFDRNFLLKN